MTEPDENGIILGKEYLFVPRVGDEAAFGRYHGRTITPGMPDPIDGTYIVDLDGPLMVYPDELVDPEVP